MDNERAIKQLVDDIENIKENLQYQENRQDIELKRIAERQVTIGEFKQQIVEQEKAIEKLQS